MTLSQMHAFEFEMADGRRRMDRIAKPKRKPRYVIDEQGYRALDLRTGLWHDLDEMELTI